MKRTILLFLCGIILIGCANDISDKFPMIVTGVKIGDQDKEYIVRVTCEDCIHAVAYIYTDSLYTIGDTLKIVKK